MSEEIKISDNELVELLPWYVNNTLTEQERQAVDELLERSEQARLQLAALKQIQQRVQDDNSITFHASELGWKRLQREIKNIKQAQSKPEKISNVGQISPWLKKAMSIAAVLVISVQAMLLLNFQQQLDSSNRLLSANTQAQKLTEQQALYQLKFNDAVSWKRVQVLLYNNEITVVAGPSAVGLITVALDKQKADDVIALLQEQSAVEYIQAVEHD